MFDDADGVGGGYSLPWQRMLSLVPRPPSARDLLEQRLLELRIAELEKATAPVAYRLATVAELPERDTVVLGGRGSGKTAFAVALAQHWAKAAGLPMWGVGWPGRVAEAVGVRVAPSDVWELRDAVVLADEHSLVAADKARMWASYALGRQHRRRVISTAQSSAVVPPDVYRLGPVLVWRAVDDVAVRFEREEVQPLVHTAASVLRSLGVGPDRWAAYCDGAWWAGRCALPEGWSDDVSQLWR
jgi:hypothetical protein